MPEIVRRHAHLGDPCPLGQRADDARHVARGQRRGRAPRAVAVPAEHGQAGQPARVFPVLPRLEIDLERAPRRGIPIDLAVLGPLALDQRAVRHPVQVATPHAHQLAHATARGAQRLDDGNVAQARQLAVAIGGRLPAHRGDRARGLDDRLDRLQLGIFGARLAPDVPRVAIALFQPGNVRRVQGQAALEQRAVQAIYGRQVELQRGLGRLLGIGEVLVAQPGHKVDRVIDGQRRSRLAIDVYPLPGQENAKMLERRRIGVLRVQRVEAGQEIVHRLADRPILHPVSTCGHRLPPSLCPYKRVYHVWRAKTSGEENHGVTMNRRMRFIGVHHQE